jgi:hypothetical protein
MSALLREAQTREQLRKEFLVMQEAVKQTEFLIPFVFYDGTNIPGGQCRMKKGDMVWLFLDRARKVGAEVGGSDKARREWARVGVDDLMLVKGDIIIPHVRFRHPVSVCSLLTVRPALRVLLFHGQQDQWLHWTPVRSLCRTHSNHSRGPVGFNSHRRFVSFHGSVQDAQDADTVFRRS